MLKILKKYNKYIISLSILTILFVPLVVVKAQLSNTLNEQLNQSGLQNVYGNQQNLPQMIGNGVKVVLGILGLILVILIIYAGFLWMTAQGDAKKVEKAKDMLKQAIVGLIIVFAAYAITNFVITSLSTVAGNTQ